jgi:ABC-type amino acid transport substrate-binding protein
MLIGGRSAIIIEHEAVMSYLLKIQGPDSQLRVRSAGCLETPLPLVVGFCKRNPATPDLIKTVNEGIDQLESSGRLALLKKKYIIEI